ncbi:AI-2E family transporter [Rhodocaloribacter litoris]|uniref:AI-2E family transporter n=1 Tax=Rhodocaloribacter litoris TaxID=2558931 RepID=UPI001421BF78|nr:AI-2E family transporter [Rhodocaloribacter litoris]QXD16495.1 AI-2E family transporter [Rhodocaloribacter litoris]
MDDASAQKPARSSAGASPLSASEVALLAGGLALFLVLLYLMRDFLNPLIVAAAFGILLWPLRAHRAARALLLTGGFLLVFWLVDELSVILLPFAVAYLLAYLCNPAVDFMHARLRTPRWVSALVMTALVVGVVALFVLMLVPSIVGQLEVLATRILGNVGNLRAWLLNLALLDQLEAAGLVDKGELIRQFTQVIQEQATALASGIPNAAKEVVQSLSSVIGLVTIIALIPVLFFYTLKDYPLITARLIELFPTFGGRRDYLLKAGSVVGNYLRGQITISAIVATMVSLALLLFGVPFALLIGLLAGLLNMIPNLGIIITYFIGGLIALAFGGVVDLVIVVAVLLGESFLEQSVLTPNILGQRVGLHPVLILLALFVFGFFMGILGLLIAVPATALIVAAYQAYREELTIDLAAYGDYVRGARSKGGLPAEDGIETSAPPVQPTEAGTPETPPET